MIPSRNDPFTSWWFHFMMTPLYDPFTLWSLDWMIDSIVHFAQSMHTPPTLNSSPSLCKKSSSRPPWCSSCSARPALQPAVSLLMNRYIPKPMFLTGCDYPDCSTTHRDQEIIWHAVNVLLAWPFPWPYVDDSQLIQTNRVWSSREKSDLMGHPERVIRPIGQAKQDCSLNKWTFTCKPHLALCEHIIALIDERNANW